MMKTKSHTGWLVARVVLAAVLLGGMLWLAARDLFPNASPWWVLRVGLFVLAAVGALIVLQALVGAAWHRFSLNRGATDPGWMWFGGEPPGLTRERERSAKAVDLAPPESEDPPR